MRSQKLSSSNILLSFIFLVSFYTSNAFNKGIVVVPVADLVGQPMQQFHPHQSVLQSYKNLPWAQLKLDYEACPRLHQLLHHEIVDIIRIQGQEIEISIPQVFYQTMSNNAPQDIYWTLSKNIMRLDPKKYDLAKLPGAINYKNPDSIKQPNVVTLLEPFYEQTTNQTLSAGTRFVKAGNDQANVQQLVYFLNPQSHRIITISIPATLLYDGATKTDQERIIDFIAILRTWAQQSGGIIPYVWGGCSYTERLDKNQFKLDRTTIHGKLLGSYDRPDHKNHPKSGFDCSSIIMRAAQAVGLPYFYKNTYTITQHLPLLKAQEKIQQGDLVWIRGHIFVVADVQENTLFEAHAYDGGYGKVHEIAVSKVFKGIKTLQDLVTVYRKHQPLERLNDKGEVFSEYKEVKLLRFGGQWV